ncbi:DUF5666 domain-containing protein [Brevibacillus ginsengisoli]|uniref:DUF5666 domain-containing protein n=1 Tax=Brevibacillus ginsengisoli TaxID=363854 RepID=UPI003CF26AA3
MRKWSILLLCFVLLFTFGSATFAKTVDKQKEKTVRVSGAITAVDPQASTITVQAKGGTILLTIDRSSKVRVTEFKNPTLADIWVGDQATATYVQKDDLNTLKEIQVFKKRGYVRGAVDSVDTEGQTLSVAGGKKIAVSDKTVIRMKKDKLTLADLIAGDQIEASGFLKEGVLQAAQIEVKRTIATVRGKIESIQADKNQLVVAGMTVNVKSSTKLRLMEFNAKFADLLVGDQVVVVGTKKLDTLDATTINVNRKVETLEGKVTGIDTNNHTISLGDKLITISDQTKIVKDGKYISLEKIQVGTDVEAKGYIAGDKMIALRVNVKKQEDSKDVSVTGSIDQINFTAKTMVVAGKSVLITDSMVVTDDKDQKIALTDLKTGLTVEVTGEWKDNKIKAKKIKVQAQAPVVPQP